MKFKEPPKNINFPELEEEILKFWTENKLFEKSLNKNKGKAQYVFYDGPPFATGLPHYGHLLPGTIKDIVPRYQTMKGKYVERVWGWDCHGLPVENLIEKELGLNSKKEILEYGIDKFNEACRNSVLRYTKEWEKTIDRMGRWVDFRNSYRTMDPQYMESIWWVFKTLWEKGLIYEGYKILPYCPRCSTPLSNFETNQGYRDVQDPAITIAFELKNENNTFILAWTTTPWTLPSNMALAVGEDIDYVKIEDEGRIYILAEILLPKYYKDITKVKVLDKFKGTKLVGQKYVPLFPFFKDLEKEGAFRVVLGHHVSTDSGTGVVHIAPGFGEDDAEIGKKEKLPTVCPIDSEAKFTEEVYDYKGIPVKKADKDIIKRLKDEKKLIKHETYQHSYPHCWRCDEPLIYRAITSWFVDIQKIKDGMVAANSKINWVPEHIKEGRFGKWVEGARDWAISRNRYWGCPIPVWKCDDCGANICVGNITELEKLSKSRIMDIHKHFVDKIKLKCKCGGEMTRIEEVLDCWFESGAMPYAQNHYPFENKEKFESTFPADFISESLDQTRGWFYTLLVLGVALFDKNSYQNVVCSGLVLAEDGKKMSKRLNNYPEVDYIFDKYGADALRLYLMNSSLVKAGELYFSEHGVQEVLRSFHLPLWNAYSFFATYAVVDGWDPEMNISEKFSNPLDIWLNSFTEKLVADMDKALGEYDFQKAVNNLYQYLVELTNWFIRRSRRRFWKSEDDTDKKEAYSSLYKALIKFCIVSAPITPYLADGVYRNLRTQRMPESVHLCDYPEVNGKIRNFELETEMELVQKTVEMGRSLRSRVSINLRRPLNAVYIITRKEEERNLLKKMELIIKEELNVKGVIYESEEEKLVTLSCKANFRSLGKKAGKDMKDVAERIMKFTSKEANLFDDNKEMVINVNGKDYSLTKEDVLVERKEKEGLTITNEGSLTIALDTKLTDALIDEGIAREFIRHVQNLRKDRGLEVTDRIIISYNAEDRISNAIKGWEKIIMEETLSVEIVKTLDASVAANVDDTDIKIDLKKK